MNENLYLVRIELTNDEGDALERLATRDCRMIWEQARYLLRLQMISDGVLTPNPNNEVMAKAVT